MRLSTLGDFGRLAPRRSARAAFLALLPFAVSAVAAPPLLPRPRQYQPRPGALRLGPNTTIALASGGAGDLAADRFAASTLVQELATVDHVRARVLASDAGATTAPILLARLESPAGRAALRAAGLAFPPAARAQGYALLVSPRRAVVVAASAAGLFYGAQTLRQMFHPAAGGGARAPAARILDWPSFAHRGVSVDISRGPVPTLSDIERQIALLAEFKVNVYSLYFENTFAYPALPVAAAWGGALSPAEARAIVAFARPYHVEVIPDQESFGHLHLALTEERFQNLAEIPYGGVLTPTSPASFAFIRSMFSGLAASFPAPDLLIGADETYELGQGRTRAWAERQGAGQVFINYLRAIHRELGPLHRRLLFWGDIAVKHPELLPQLPKDMVAIPWVYDPEPSYVRYIAPFRAAGLETWVSPGVNNWSRIFPDANLAFPDIRRFAADGLAQGADGLLNTTWMDDGESMLNFCWRGLLYGAAAGWRPGVKDGAFNAAYDWALYRADGHNFSADLNQIAEIHHLLRAATGSDGEDWTVWLDPDSPRGHAYYARLDAPLAGAIAANPAPAALAAAPTADSTASQVRLLAEDVIADLGEHRARARANADLLDWMEFGARRFDYLGEKAIFSAYIEQLYARARALAADAAAAGADSGPGAARRRASERSQVRGLLGRINGVDGLVEDLRNSEGALLLHYRALWLAENRPYELENALIRHQDELEFWQAESRRLTAARDEFRRSGLLPPWPAA